ncbi:glycoside hydrolase family 2 TIM barrel-domain containing protein [Treponema sp.]|uniref:glycoside hydrolase family 2 TIM barrel-domain containing protein n=1 Tax=Treponema sp. TaxID=166 RepID=UPI0025D58BBC|nr:glycoside hydrolase family 2 TIM barrel-domain containing protein [Treponema sp.]MCR5217358.1 hypothetical protein [Treponema sp.]
MLKKKLAIFAAALLSFATAVSAEKITVRQDAGGWKIYDGKTAVEIKGIVWSFTPIGESFSYNLFAQDDAFIQKMIDTDMPMLKAMGVNTIRCFTTIPPKWVEYIYTKYGIYTMINDLLGRYGVSVNGTWYAQTDYSDFYTRQTLIEQARQTALAYKDCKGVIMYMFGNESNYGLVWSSTEIEDLPVGDQNVVKAAYLYDLLEQAMAVCKDVDPNRPIGIVNGDVGNLELIAKLCPSLDILGVNVYRGYKAYDSLYENVADVLNKPIVFTEFGADAYNDILHQEDQTAQLTYMKSQWQEIYEQSYGKGKCQNILGGYVFEWMDEWWKRYQTKNLDLHDDASWANAGYDIDYREGVNNMSEEWFGICGQSPLKENGINVRIPRAAYYMLKDVWSMSLYNSSSQEVARKFASLNDAEYIARGNEKSIKQTLNENKKVEISQLTATVNATTPVYLNALIDDIKDGTRNWASDFRYKNAEGEINEPTVTAEATLGVTVRPFENLEGEAVIKAVTGEPYTRIADHWASYYEDTGNLYGNNSSDEDQIQYVDVYSASFNYTNDMFDLNGYYHVGHAGFEGKGDPFCISAEGFDIIGYDTYGSKAPIALEFIGHGLLEGLEVIGGPEIVGGACPQVQANYFKWIPSVGPLDGIVFNATAAAEFASSENVLIDPYNGYGGGYKASVYGETYIMPWFQLKAGVLTAGSEKIGAYYINGDKEIDQVDFLDTLGAQIELGTNMFQHSYIFTKAIYRGVVADTNAAIARGSFFTADSGSGNRFEVQLGAELTYGDMVFKPVVRARTPLEKPMGRSLVSGSPFVVGLGNRQAVEVEAVFTYDPEGGTWFHEWNSEDIEGAPWAFSVTGLYQLYAGKTDNLCYKSDSKTTVNRNDGTTVTDYEWYDGGALDLQNNLFQVGTRWVLNPPQVPGLRAIINANVGRLSASTGAWEDAGSDEFCTFVSGGIAARYKHFIGSLDCTVNGWGTESWWRDFNMTFPLQYTLDLAYAFGTNPSFLDSANRIGLKIVGKNFGEDSSDAYGALPYGASVDGAMYMEVTTYFSIGL